MNSLVQTIGSTPTMPGGQLMSGSMHIFVPVEMTPRYARVITACALTLMPPLAMCAVLLFRIASMKSAMSMTMNCIRIPTILCSIAISAVCAASIANSSRTTLTIIPATPLPTAARAFPVAQPSVDLTPLPATILISARSAVRRVSRRRLVATTGWCIAVMPRTTGRCARTAARW